MAAPDKPARVERTFYPDGSPKEEIHYRGESCHGPWRAWHENGVLKREWFYDRHVFADGVHRSWHDNGRLAFQLTTRNGYIITEESYSRSGKRVPTLQEQVVAHERKFIERAAEKARAATPSKRGRRIAEEEAKRSKALIERLLATRTAPAREWLGESDGDVGRTLGELDHAASVVLVDLLHDLGAAEVLAVEIQADDFLPAQTTNHLVVVLPTDAAPRARLISFANRLARRQGFTSDSDWGQTHIYMMLC